MLEGLIGGSQLADDWGTVVYIDHESVEKLVGEGGGGAAPSTLSPGVGNSLERVHGQESLKGGGKR